MHIVIPVPWELSMEEVDCSFVTEDLAKLAVLYLNNGIWNGVRLLSESWVKEFTKMQFRDSWSHSNPTLKARLVLRIWFPELEMHTKMRIGLMGVLDS